jgi:tetratricopeptide (TPR) repeat protein
LVLGGGGAAIAATASLLGGVFRDSAPAGAGSYAARVSADGLQSGFAAGDTRALVGRLQETLRANPDDGMANAALGWAYQQRARETGDPSYYPKSEGVLLRALDLDPRDLTATTGLGALALARHRFRDALALGRRARALSPRTARSYGVIGDALVELGRYREAFAAFDTMARLRPGVAAYSRVSYGRELLGDVPGAIEAMRLALEASAGQREPYAWTAVQLGKIHWNAGRLDEAERAYRQALAVVPGYIYALDALAQVAAAEGRFARAIALERRAVETIPLPQFVAFLGDLYRVTGRNGAARREYALMDAIRRLLVAGGVRADLEMSLFYVDRGLRLPRALAMARRSYRDRPSLDGNDVLAWALARTGRCGEALRYSKRALRLGTRDASKFFHRGMIERCLGDRREARAWFRRAVETNPHFSLIWAPAARRYAS